MCNQRPFIGNARSGPFSQICLHVISDLPRPQINLPETKSNPFSNKAFVLKDCQY